MKQANVKQVENKLHQIIQPLLEEGYYMARYDFRIRRGRVPGLPGTSPDLDGAMCIKGAIESAQPLVDIRSLNIDHAELRTIECGFEGFEDYEHTEWYKLGERIRATYNA